MTHRNNSVVGAARQALRAWDPDSADEGEAEAIFRAIYGRPSDDDENVIDLIFASIDVLTRAEAGRVNAILR